jgi:hypothetical protein
MHPTSAVRDFSRFAGNLASGKNKDETLKAEKR